MTNAHTQRSDVTSPQQPAWRRFATTEIDPSRRTWFLIEASAGTGKTWTLSQLVLWCLLVDRKKVLGPGAPRAEQPLHPRELLVVTFTKKAAGELQERIQERLLRARVLLDNGNNDDEAGRALSDEDAPLWELLNLAKPHVTPSEEVAAALTRDANATPKSSSDKKIVEEELRRRIRRALYGIHQAQISTIHSFAQRVLRDYTDRIDLPPGLEVGEHDLVRELAYTFWNCYVLPSGYAGPIQLERKRNNKSRSNWGPDTYAELGKRLLGLEWSSQPRAFVVDQYGLELADLSYEQLLSRLQTCRDELARMHADWAKALARVRVAWDAVRDEWPELQGRFARVPTDNQLSHFDATIRREPEPLTTTSGQRWMQAVQKFAQLSASDSETLPDSLRALIEAARGLHKIFEQIDQAENKHYHRQANFLHAAFVPWFLQAYDQALARAERCSFQDLIRSVARAVQEPAFARTLAERWPVTLIDEFQDTDPLQLEIFTKVYGEPFAERQGAAATLAVVVGDPKQAIYGFRGADVYSYLRIAKAFANLPEKDRARYRLTLNTNYRSDAAVVEAINRLFRAEDANEQATKGDSCDSGDPRDHYEKNEAHHGRRLTSLPLWPLEADGTEETPPGIRIVELQLEQLKQDEGERTAAEYVALRIAYLVRQRDRIALGIEQRSLRLNDIAVLVGENKQLSLLQRALARRGITAAAAGSVSIFATPEAYEWLAIWSALANPTEARIRAALTTRIGRLQIPDLADPPKEDTPDLLERARRWIDEQRDRLTDPRRLGKVVGALLRDGFAPEASSAGNTGQTLAEWLLRQPGGLRSWTNFRHLAELTLAQASRRHLGLDELVTELGERIFGGRDETAVAPEEQQLRLERDEEAVQLLTMHSAKGLEWPIVFCPYLRSKSSRDPYWIVHLSRKGDTDTEAWQTTLDLTKQHKEEKERELLHESLRLTYVALTRARHYAEAIVVTEDPEQQKKPKEDAVKAFLLTAKERADGACLAYQLVRWSELRQAAEAAAALSEREGEATPEADAERQGQELETGVCALPQDLPVPWHSHSYTGWRRGLERSGGPRDEATAEGHDEVETGAPGEDEAGEVEAEETVATLELTEAERRLFPPGAQTGKCWHRFLERVLTDPDATDAELAVDAVRRYFGIQEEEITLQRICKLVDHWKRWQDGRFGAAQQPLTLGELAARARKSGGTVPALCELTFHLPLARPITFGELAERILAALADDPLDGPDAAAAPGWRSRYRPYLEPVLKASKPLRGVFEGTVDLLVRDDGGRWWIVDYKSTALREGSTWRELLVDHHYLLQAVLYAVGVRRFLRHRLGAPPQELRAQYLFLRAFGPNAPRTGAHAPVQEIRFADAGLAELEALFAQDVDQELEG